MHPTGLVHPDEPDAKVKFLAAEALRGVGGLLLDADGRRFCDELGRRDYVTGEMWKSRGPFRLVLNSAAAREIEWHCRHYEGRGLMRRFATGAALAADMRVGPQALDATFRAYNAAASAGGPDRFGKRFFRNAPFRAADAFYAAVVTPVVHYCMGGLAISPAAQVCVCAVRGLRGTRPPPQTTTTASSCAMAHRTTRHAGAAVPLGRG